MDDQPVNPSVRSFILYVLFFAAGVALWYFVSEVRSQERTRQSQAEAKMLSQQCEKELARVRKFSNKNSKREQLIALRLRYIDVHPELAAKVDGDLLNILFDDINMFRKENARILQEQATIASRVDSKDRRLQQMEREAREKLESASRKEASALAVLKEKNSLSNQQRAFAQREAEFAQKERDIVRLKQDLADKDVRLAQLANEYEKKAIDMAARERNLQETMQKIIEAATKQKDTPIIIIPPQAPPTKTVIIQERGPYRYPVPQVVTIKETRKNPATVPNKPEGGKSNSPEIADAQTIVYTK